MNWRQIKKALGAFVAANLPAVVSIVQGKWNHAALSELVALAVGAVTFVVKNESAAPAPAAPAKSA